MNEKKDYKDIFLSFLSTQYDAFDWERESKDMTQEVRTDFNGYGLRIVSTHEGYFLQIFDVLDITVLFYYTDRKMSVGIPIQEILMKNFRNTHFSRL